MGKLTEEVFNPSCCEGGATSEKESAQPCGCDLGAGWVCSAHQQVSLSDILMRLIQLEEKLNRLLSLTLK